MAGNLGWGWHSEKAGKAAGVVRRASLLVVRGQILGVEYRRLGKKRPGSLGVGGGGWRLPFTSLSMGLTLPSTEKLLRQYDSERSATLPACGSDPAAQKTRLSLR